MLDLRTERQTFIEVLDHESRRIIRMVRSFPVAQFERRHADCGMSAHDLVTGFVRHARRLESLAKGPEVGDPFASARTRGGLLLEYELAVTHVRETLADLGCEETPANVAAAVEFLLEGLHLSKRLNKDAVDGRATYRSRSGNR